jgi:hypothetical protein
MVEDKQNYMEASGVEEKQRLEHKGLPVWLWIILGIAVLAMIGYITNMRTASTPTKQNSVATENSTSSSDQTSQPNVQTSNQTAQPTPASAVQTPNTTAPTSTASSGKIVPPQYEINADLRRTVEVSDPSFSFLPDETVTVSDGNGGWLTAVHGTRNPTADGYGQLIFFWHNNQFIGYDATYESNQSSIADSGSGYFVISYAHYADRDPMSTPSLPNVNITYTWNGKSFTSSGSPPTNIYGAYEKLIYVKYIS